MPEPRKKKRARTQTPEPSLDAAIGDGLGVPSTTQEDAVVMEGSILEKPVETDVLVGPDDRERVVEEHNGTGVAQLLQDPEFMNHMITEMVANSTLDSVTEEVADKLSDALQDNPEFRGRLVDALMSSETAKAKFITATIRALG